jgi:hypothetical protein
MAILRTEPPPVLYHYTTLTGLLGIVNSKVLWATDIRYLHDEKEFHLALDITRSLLTELRDSSAPSTYAPFIPSLLSKIDAIDAPGIFVTCFTGNGDLLSQWRGYCGPEVGCSIGWTGEALIAAALNSRLCSPRASMNGLGSDNWSMSFWTVPSPMNRNVS